MVSIKQGVDTMSEINLHALKRLRKQRGFTVENVARYLGFKNAVSYWRVENGKVTLKASHLKDLSDLYNLPMEQFFRNPKEKIQIPKVHWNSRTSQQLIDLYSVLTKYCDNFLQTDKHLDQIKKELTKRGITMKF